MYTKGSGQFKSYDSLYTIRHLRETVEHQYVSALRETVLLGSLRVWREPNDFLANQRMIPSLFLD